MIRGKLNDKDSDKIVFSLGLVLLLGSLMAFQPTNVTVNDDLSNNNLRLTENASFNFELSNPSRVNKISVELDLKYKEIPLTNVYLNGERKTKFAEEPYFELTGEEFSKQNRVVLSGDRVIFNEIRIQDVKVNVERRNYSRYFVALFIGSVILISKPVITHIHR